MDSAPRPESNTTGFTNHSKLHPSGGCIYQRYDRNFQHVFKYSSPMVSFANILELVKSCCLIGLAVPNCNYAVWDTVHIIVSYSIYVREVKGNVSCSLYYVCENGCCNPPTIRLHAVYVLVHLPSVWTPLLFLFNILALMNRYQITCMRAGVNFG